MIRRPPRSTHCISSAASDVYKRQDLKQCHIQFEFDWQSIQQEIFFKFICNQSQIEYHEVKVEEQGFMAGLKEQIELCYSDIIISNKNSALHIFFGNAEDKECKECINYINIMLNCSNFWVFMKQDTIQQFEKKIRENPLFQKCNFNQIVHICMYIFRTNLKLVFIINKIQIEHPFLENFQNFYNNFIRINKFHMQTTSNSQYQLVSHKLAQNQILTQEEINKLIKLYNLSSIIEGGEGLECMQGARDDLVSRAKQSSYQVLELSLIHI
eukprot:TRINITY_DN6414_c0_g1_i1.p1 TRINITY_DN6414_c0_g1~~TRINITY_DN6414_c0_g1_i1.p1  ORF type:complete len:269 (+),score=53.81 TRINITY_DN6414_c0_g1_i1:97-903(+)